MVAILKKSKMATGSGPTKVRCRYWPTNSRHRETDRHMG